MLYILYSRKPAYPMLVSMYLTCYIICANILVQLCVCVCLSVYVCVRVCYIYSVVFLLSLVAEAVIDTATKLQNTGILIKITVGDKQQLVLT